ncbi:MAG: copper-translocating P-type ATPase [Saprospiraceae bacterium]|nr:copper-translocating P-type ATPase [Saprospiraceae bacterium]
MDQIEIQWSFSKINNPTLAYFENIFSDYTDHLEYELFKDGIHLRSERLQEILPTIIQKLQDEGFAIPWVHKLYRVKGMSCANCALNIEKILKKQTGVVSAAVNFANAVLQLSFLENKISSEALEKIISEYSYALKPIPSISTNFINQQDESELVNQRKIKAVWALLICIPVIWLGMFHMHWKFTPWCLWLLSTPVIFYWGRDYFLRAWSLARHGSVSMDTLVSLSSLVAYFTSLFYLFSEGHQENAMGFVPVYFESAAVVIAFLLLGKWLEEKTKFKTGSALRKLMELHPPKVIRKGENGDFFEIKSTSVIPGDLLVARPGDRIAVDGMVESGQSNVDEIMMTGESVPVFKQEGDWLTAGTSNLDGSLEYRAKNVGMETRLAQMIEWVQKAQASKAHVQQFADRIAGIFVPVVIAMASFAFLCWYFLDSENGLQNGILAFVTVLIVACPCALGLATPTAVVVGMGKAAQLGILIRDAKSLEQIQKVDTLVFDKTGTITRGSAKLTKVSWLTDGLHRVDILQGMAERSGHPFAKSLLDEFNWGTNIQPEAFTNHSGLGIAAVFEGKEYFLGSQNFLKKEINKQADFLFDFDREASQSTESQIYFFNREQVLAVFCLQDEIKEGIPGLMDAFKKENLAVWMLTGDKKSVAQKIAEEAGIDHWKAELSPMDKLDFVKAQQKAGHVVAMIGDGVNDSPALAQADVGIAMGLGADIAKETADLVLISSDLSKIPQALKISRRTLQTIRQNMFWAFFYNFLGIPLAAGLLFPWFGIWLNPMMAGLAMALSSISVVLNSLRLKFAD